MIEALGQVEVWRLDALMGQMVSSARLTGLEILSDLDLVRRFQCIYFDRFIATLKTN